MSKDNTQHALVPRLRFPEFRHMRAWNENALTGICDVNPTHSGLPESFYYIDLESVEAGTLQNPQWIERANAPSRAQRLLRDGDILYQTVRPYQRNNLLFNFANGEDYVASTGYAQLRARESIGFLYQLIHTDSFVERVLAKCTGSNYPAINSSVLESVAVWIPPDSAEQQKIAACLGSLDDLIAAEGRKLAGLREHKQGLMQQLFPREDETQPRLRFPEFLEDESGFEQVANFAKVTTGDKDTQNKVDEGQYPFFVRSQNVERIDSYSCDGEAVLTSGDGVGVGENYHYINGRFDFHQRVYCIYEFSSEVNGRYFFHYFSQHFKKRVKQMSAKNSVDSVRMAMITEMPIWLPKIKEQNQIADCLAALDALIAAQAEKLDALRTHKRGLMQQLFPSPEDAEA